MSKKQPISKKRAMANEARRQLAIDEATFFDDAEAFREWLEDNADRSHGIWIRFAKPDSGVEGGTRAEALDEALCFGWIDAQLLKDNDARFTLQRFTPRGPRSLWSQVNRDRVAELIAEGRVAPRGLDEYETAKEDGRLAAAYAPRGATTVPDDFAVALEASPKAKAFFEGVDERNTYAILHRIETANTPETRARRIATFVEMLSEGEALYPRRAKRRPV